MQVSTTSETRRVGWIRVNREVFADLSTLAPEDRMARSLFLLDSSKRGEAIEELRYTHNGNHINGRGGG